MLSVASISHKPYQKYRCPYRRLLGIMYHYLIINKSSKRLKRHYVIDINILNTIIGITHSQCSHQCIRCGKLYECGNLDTCGSRFQEGKCSVCS